MSNGAAAAEQVVETVAKIEPTVATVVSMFVPGAAPIVALVQPWAPFVLGYVERALTDISTGNGGDIGAAFIELLQHVSKGQPNSPILTAAAPPATSAAIGVRPDVPA